MAFRVGDGWTRRWQSGLQAHPNTCCHAPFLVSSPGLPRGWTLPFVGSVETDLQAAYPWMTDVPNKHFSFEINGMLAQ